MRRNLGNRLSELLVLAVLLVALVAGLAKLVVWWMDA